MRSRDITWEVCKYLDNAILKKAYICGIVPELPAVLGDDLFWKERVLILVQEQNLDGVLVSSWRELYYRLRRVLYRNSNTRIRSISLGVLLNAKVTEEEFLETIRCGDVGTLCAILQTGFDYRCCQPCPLSVAVRRGYTHVLLPLLSSDEDELGERGTYALQAAYTLRRYDMVRPLLERGAVPSDQTVWKAIEAWDDPETLSLLLAHPKSDPTADGNLALKYAVRDARIGSLELLLNDPRVDPTYNNCEILKTAASVDIRWRDAIMSVLVTDERFMVRIRTRVHRRKEDEHHRGHDRRFMSSPLP